LRDLVALRMRCRLTATLVVCVDSFLKFRSSGPSEIWIGCPEVMLRPSDRNVLYRRRRVLPRWLNRLLSRYLDQLKRQNFTHSLDIQLRIRREYSTALQNHATTCTGGAHKEWSNILRGAREQARIQYVSDFLSMIENTIVLFPLVRSLYCNVVYAYVAIFE
jgi:hypothetical protein